MDSPKKYPENQPPKFSPETELASPFLEEELFSDTELADSETLNTRLDALQLESPFLSVFEKPVSEDLDESEIVKTEEFEEHLDDEDEDEDDEGEELEEDECFLEESDIEDALDEETEELLGEVEIEGALPEFEDEKGVFDDAEFLIDAEAGGEEFLFDDDFDSDTEYEDFAGDLDKNEIEAEAEEGTSVEDYLMSNEFFDGKKTFLDPSDESETFENQVAPVAVGRDIKFELELNYGMEKSVGGEPRGFPFIQKSPADPDLMEEDKPTTTHTKATDGFQVVMDGPRIEIETSRFSLESEAEFNRISNNVVNFMNELAKKARATKSKRVSNTNNKHDANGDRLRISAGRPRAFKLPSFLDPSFVAFPTINSRKQKTWFRSSTSIGCAPQLTIDIPLGSVIELVNEIRQSQLGRRPVRITGLRKARAGLRSDALYDAHDAVLKSFRNHAKAGTATSTQLTKRLAGFVILLVMYFRTSEIRYHRPDRPNDPTFEVPDKGSRDHEQFAKSYVPVVVHTHFGVLFRKSLDDDERKLFMKLYGYLGVRQSLFDLALNRAGSKDGTAELFPARTRALHKHNLGRVLTWNDLLNSAIDPASPILNSAGDETLPTPLATASKGPATAGRAGARVKGVRLELRRIGYRWWSPQGWQKMANFSFKMAQKLNGISP